MSARSTAGNLSTGVPEELRSLRNESGKDRAFAAEALATLEASQMVMNIAHTHGGA